MKTWFEISIDRVPNSWKRNNHLVLFLCLSTMASKSMVSQLCVCWDPWSFYIYFLVESRAICRYLESKYKSKGTELIPTKNVTALGLFEQAASIETFNFDPYASGIVFEKVFKKYIVKGISIFTIHNIISFSLFLIEGKV